MFDNLQHICEPIFGHTRTYTEKLYVCLQHSSNKEDDRLLCFSSQAWPLKLV